MSDALLRFYHMLPPGARSAVATMRGVYLRWLRYGPESERLARAAAERDYWSPAEWARWRQERLSHILHRAATRVPYYREYWQDRRRRGDRAAWDQLENWPVLEKDIVRDYGHALVADDRDRRRLFHERTSGTTGKAVDIWRSRATATALHAVGLVRTRGWNSVPRGTHWARFGGQLVVPATRQKPPFWVWNAALHQLYMSTFHLGPQQAASYLDALAAHSIRYLAGYTSSLYALAQDALRLGRDDLPMLAVVTSAEPLAEHERATISRAFHCPVRETYGMTENVAAASECSAGGLHLWPEVGVVEVLEDGQPVPAGESGDLVCTGLLNEDMPLIRYRVGDRGRLAPEDDGCACGRRLPRLAGIDGRSRDVLITRDGRRVFSTSAVWVGLPVRHGQIVQETLDRVCVRYVPASGFGPAARETLTTRVRQRLGPVELVLDEVSEIERTAAGKICAQLCNLSAAERVLALGAAPLAGPRVTSP